MSSSPACTPPRPRCDEENLSSPVKKSIEWSKTKQVVSFSPGTPIRIAKFQSSSRPAKPILKPQRPLLPFSPVKGRDFTPFPQDALANAEYLVYPVSVILNKESGLRELTEAYSILTARIKESVPIEFFVIPDEKRHRLFNPIRQNARALATCICRDICRVFQNPFTLPEDSECLPPLPTPRQTPTPKKGGLTEDQVKEARDLTTTSLAVARLLILVTCSSNIYSAFSDECLAQILDAVVSIPVSDRLRSPGSRKIHGLTMAILQSQRLPAHILESAKARIVFAVRRGILGELGREGKKGATSDALKAFHDLCVYQPDIFVPELADILTCVLDALLYPSLPIRVQAAHALGGYARGFASCCHYSTLSAPVSTTITDFFMRDQPTVGQQTTLQRTLQTALRTQQPTHHAQGPFWAVSVLASMVILAGPSLFTNYQLLRDVYSLLKITSASSKKSIRAATMMVWMPMVRVWFMHHETNQFEEEEDDDASRVDQIQAAALFSKILLAGSNQPTLFAILSALMGKETEECPKENMTLVLFALRDAFKAGGSSSERGLEALDRMINRTDAQMATFDDCWTKEFEAKLVVKDMHTVSPGLLTSELTQVTTAVERIVAQRPTVDDLRPFSDSERKSAALWIRLRDIWLSAFEQLELGETESPPDVTLDIWAGLLRMKVSATKGTEDQRTAIAESCAEALIAVIANERINMYMPPPTSSAKHDACSSPSMLLKLKLVRVLWSTACGTLSKSTLRYAIKPLIRYLVKNYTQLVPSDDANHMVLGEWAQLAAQIAAVGTDTTGRVLWTTTWDWDLKTRAHVWRSFARGWREDDRGSWRGACIILSLPFESEYAWNMSDADLKEWSSLLEYAVNQAEKLPVKRTSALDIATGYIDQQLIHTLPSSIRAADYLLAELNKGLESCSALPISLLDFVHEVMQTCYPPEPCDKEISLWLLRSLQTTVINCPSQHLVRLLEVLHNGVCIWLTNECGAFSSTEFSNDVIPLYQTILIQIQSVQPSASVIQSLADLLHSSLASTDNSEAVNSFREFWRDCGSNIHKPREGWKKSLQSALEISDCTMLGIANADGDEADELDVLSRHAHVNFLALDTTPKRSTIAAPLRPKRMSMPFPVDTPSSPSYRKVRAAAARRVSGERRHGENITTLQEKENVSPLAHKSPLGKRRGLEDHSPELGKRRRTISGNVSPMRSPLRDRAAISDDCESDCDAVEAALPLIGSDDCADTFESAGPIKGVKDGDLGTRSRPIVIDPPSPPKRKRSNLFDALPPRLRAAKMARMAYMSHPSSSSDYSDSSSSPMPATPTHHSLLPSALCRVAASDEDPPSDDSTFFQSPTKDAMRRRLSRSSSSFNLSKRPSTVPLGAEVIVID